MGEITAQAVKAFREKTGLPFMDCKRALAEAGGDEAKAIELLRKSGEKLELKRAGRTTDFGRFGMFRGLDQNVAAMVELKCESAPVAQNEEFIQLARSVYRENDRRAAIKRRINLANESQIVEEKSYTDYDHREAHDSGIPPE